LYDIVDNPDFWVEVFQNPSQVWTPEELIIIFNQESLFPKGTDWNYSSVPGYGLLRTIIEDITGSDITTVYNDLFFDAFELNNTFATKGEPLPANIAHSWYDLNGDGVYDDFYSWPRTAIASGACGEVFSTAEDLAKWARVLYHDRSVLSEQFMDQMLTFHSPCTGEEFMIEGYGLGVEKFSLEFVNGINVIGHGGDAAGYAAACMYLTDYDVCIGFMDNTTEGNAMGTIFDLFDIIIEHLE
ncbi:serine hydrolase domain-containing protein, partial [Candidatus Cloacimonadota bacterium]